MMIDPLAATSSSAAGSAPLGVTLETPEQKKLWQASKAMESLFSGYLLEEVGKGLPGAGKAPGSDIYADLFKQAIADQLANKHSLGIADLMYNKAAARLTNSSSTTSSNAITSPMKGVVKS